MCIPTITSNSANQMAEFLDGRNSDWRIEALIWLVCIGALWSNFSKNNFWIVLSSIPLILIAMNLHIAIRHILEAKFLKDIHHLEWIRFNNYSNTSLLHLRHGENMAGKLTFKYLATFPKQFHINQKFASSARSWPFDVVWRLVINKLEPTLIVWQCYTYFKLDS